MKKLTLLLILPLMTISNMMAQRITISQNCEVSADFGKENGYVYIDLGLPSGLKWAMCNVGAANPWDYGDYFAWGETVGYGKSYPSNAHNYAYGNTYVKTYYYWDTYKWCNGTQYNTLTKYNTKSDYGSVLDKKTTLDLADDAARVNMGGSWRMPTSVEQKELADNCYWEWTDNYNGKGVAGYIVYKVKDASDKGKTKYSGGSVTTVGSYSLLDTHIFLPAAGYRYKSDLNLSNAGRYGCFWSSSLHGGSPNYAYYLSFDSGKVSDGYRSFGQSVRAVVE